MKQQKHPLGTIPMIDGHPLMIAASLFPSASRRPQIKVAYAALNENANGKVLADANGATFYRMVMS